MIVTGDRRVPTPVRSGTGTETETDDGHCHGRVHHHRDGGRDPDPGPEIGTMTGGGIGTTVGEIVTMIGTDIERMTGETVPETNTGIMKTGAAGNGAIHRMMTGTSGGGWRALLHERKTPNSLINVGYMRAHLVAGVRGIQTIWVVYYILLCIMTHFFFMARDLR